MASDFNSLKTDPFSVCWFIWRLHSPPNSDMDYRILTCVCDLSICVYTRQTSSEGLFVACSEAVEKPLCLCCSEVLLPGCSRHYAELCRDAESEKYDGLWLKLESFFVLNSNGCCVTDRYIKSCLCFNAHKFDHVPS